MEPGLQRSLQTPQTSWFQPQGRKNSSAAAPASIRQTARHLPSKSSTSYLSLLPPSNPHTLWGLDPELGPCAPAPMAPSPYLMELLRRPLTHSHLPWLAVKASSLPLSPSKTSGSTFTSSLGSCCDMSLSLPWVLPAPHQGPQNPSLRPLTSSDRRALHPGCP